MKIINFKAENIKRLSAVEITPDGNVVKITGKNASGKTSILDSIMFALGGLGSVQAVPLRKGQDKGHIILDLGTIIVERHFAEKDGQTKSELVIRNKEGAKYNSPQKMLDEMVGRLSFDPLEFMRLKASEKFAALRELLQLDFKDLDAKRQAAYDRRTDHGRRYRELVAQRDGVKFDPLGAKAEVSTALLLTEYQEAMQFNAGIGNAKQQVQEIDQDIKRADEVIGELERKIEELREAIKRQQARRPNFEAIASQQPKNTAAIQERINSSESDNRNARAFQEHNALSEKVEAVAAAGKKCAEEITAVDAEKAERISKAAMPVPGLEFGEGVVLFNGIPLEQASAAEQLRVSVAMAMAMNPKLRVLRITDGSLLDSESMKALETMATDADYQVWVELVDESGQVGIVIEDGHVKNPAPAQ